MKCSLGISNFLEEVSSFPFYWFPLFLCVDHWGRLSYLFSLVFSATTNSLLSVPLSSCRSLMTHASTGDPHTIKGRSGLVSCGFTVPFPGSWYAQGFVVPSKSLFSQFCTSSVIKSCWPSKSDSLRILSLFAGSHVGKSFVKPRTFSTVWELLWYNFSPVCGLPTRRLCGGANGSLIQEDLCLTPCLPGLLQPEPLFCAGHCWPMPLQETLKHSKAGLIQSLMGSLLLCLGPGAHKVLFVPSKHLWQVWSLILNVIMPLLLSYCSFSFALAPGISVLVGSNILLLMVVQQLVVILVLSQQKMSTHPSAPPSYFFCYVIGDLNKYNNKGIFIVLCSWSAVSKVWPMGQKLSPLPAFVYKVYGNTATTIPVGCLWPHSYYTGRVN